MARKRRVQTRGISGAAAARLNCAEELRIDDWDLYFHAMAQAAARKSKDPRCRVGAVIVSEDNVVLATGFNGLARGVFDDDRVLKKVPEKLRWICHAETNAIYNAARTGVSLKGCMIFVTKFPCFACCNAITQAGLTRIYTRDDWYWEEDPFDGIRFKNPHERKRTLLKQAHIRVVAPLHPHFNGMSLPTNGHGPQGELRDRARKPLAKVQRRTS